MLLGQFKNLWICLLLAPSVVFAGRDFLVVNGADQAINKIFISSSESKDWGSDLLGKDVLRNGYQQGYTLGDGSDCIYDIRVEYTEGWVEEKYEVNLCQIDRVVFNGDKAQRLGSEFSEPSSTGRAAEPDNGFEQFALKGCVLEGKYSRAVCECNAKTLDRSLSDEEKANYRAAAAGNLASSIELLKVTDKLMKAILDCSMR